MLLIIDCRICKHADMYRICPKLDDAGKLKQEMILVW